MWRLLYLQLVFAVFLLGSFSFRTEVCFLFLPLDSLAPSDVDLSGVTPSESVIILAAPSDGAPFKALLLAPGSIVNASVVKRFAGGLSNSEAVIGLVFRYQFL